MVANSKPMRAAAFVATLIALGLIGAPAAAAPRPARANSADPWEGFNRKGYAINDALERGVIRPIAKFLHFRSGPLGAAVHNFLTNLSEPVVFFNDVLQGRPRPAARTVARFTLNSTFGLIGLVDVARHNGMPHHDNGFGLTMARYGARPGPYLYLPLLGPTTVRDLIGLGVDTVSDPLFWAFYPYKTDASIGKTVISGVDAGIQAGPDLDALLSDAADPYATLRSTWLQNRQGEVDAVRGVATRMPDIADEPSAGSAPDGAQTEAPPRPTPDPPAVAAPAKRPSAAGPSPSVGARNDPAPSADPPVAGEIVSSANRVDQTPAL